jgi:hypothetical protein
MYLPETFGVLKLRMASCKMKTDEVKTIANHSRAHMKCCVKTGLVGRTTPCDSSVASIESIVVQWREVAGFRLHYSRVDGSEMLTKIYQNSMDWFQGTFTGKHHI